jgi:hypothetical protein
MHEHSFLAGLELGKFVERLTRRLSLLEDGHKKLRADFDGIIMRLRRLAILLALWAAAIGANISQDRAAELVIKFAAEALKRGS